MFGSILGTVLSFIEGSFFNVHTYVGIFLGIVFTPVWIAIWNYLTALIVKDVPAAAPFISEVTTVEKEVVSILTPIADVVDNAVTPVVTTTTTTTEKTSSKKPK